MDDAALYERFARHGEVYQARVDTDDYGRTGGLVRPDARPGATGGRRDRPCLHDGPRAPALAHRRLHTDESIAHAIAFTPRRQVHYLDEPSVAKAAAAAESGLPSTQTSHLEP